MECCFLGWNVGNFSKFSLRLVTYHCSIPRIQRSQTVYVLGPYGVIHILHVWCRNWSAEKFPEPRNDADAVSLVSHSTK